MPLSRAGLGCTVHRHKDFRYTVLESRPLSGGGGNVAAGRPGEWLCREMSPCGVGPLDLAALGLLPVSRGRIRSKGGDL